MKAIADHVGLHYSRVSRIIAQSTSKARDKTLLTLTLLTRTP